MAAGSGSLSRGDNGDSDCIQDRGITCSEAREACILEWLSLVVTMGPKAQWLAPRARVLVALWGRRNQEASGVWMWQEGVLARGRLCAHPHRPPTTTSVGPTAPQEWPTWAGEPGAGRMHGWGTGPRVGQSQVGRSSCEVLQAYFCPHGPCPERGGGGAIPFARDETWPQSGPVACLGSQLKPGLWAAVASAEDAVGLRAASVLAWCP